jgi:hypothetical protein
VVGAPGARRHGIARAVFFSKQLGRSQAEQARGFCLRQLRLDQAGETATDRDLRERRKGKGLGADPQEVPLGFFEKFANCVRPLSWDEIDARSRLARRDLEVVADVTQQIGFTRKDRR